MKQVILSIPDYFKDVSREEIMTQLTLMRDKQYADNHRHIIIQYLQRCAFVISENQCRVYQQLYFNKLNMTNASSIIKQCEFYIENLTSHETQAVLYLESLYN